VGIRKLLAVGVAAAALVGAPASAALAVDCTNASRPALNTTSLTPDYDIWGGAVQIYLVGNWAWIVVDGQGFWTFVPPGTGDAAMSQIAGVTIVTPGDNGNYTDGRHDDLLGQSQALCSPGRMRLVLRNSPLHGIWAEPQCITG
jgi:hypothetical protein